jgi:hypothetical protein
MIALLGVAGLLAAYGLFGAGRQYSALRRDRRAEYARQAQFDRRPLDVPWWSAEGSTGGPAARARRWYNPDAPDERAAALAWRTEIDDQIAEINERFDALIVPGWQTIGLDTSTAPVLDTLVELSPEVALAVVERDNAVPPVYSWTTGELPLIEREPFHPAQVRPRRRRATLRRAFDTSIRQFTH